jgi:hypothetical protein
MSLITPLSIASPFSLFKAPAGFACLDENTAKEQEAGAKAQLYLGRERPD